MTQPLREAWQAELGDKAGAEAFRRYIDFVSATSVRSSVPENVRNASYYYMLDRQGKVIKPWDEAPGNPKPYGHMAQQNQRRGAVDVQQGNWDVINNPKPPSFAENLSGNLWPVTVDAHATKLPAMSIGDPRWLLTSLKQEKDAPTIAPQKLVTSGEVSMRDALKQPTWWAGLPNKNEYGALENDLWRDIALKKGLAPAQGQAGGWTGGSKLTGNKSSSLENAPPLLREVEDRVILTADAYGLPRQEVLRRFMRGEMSLLSAGGMRPVRRSAARSARTGRQGV